MKALTVGILIAISLVYIFPQALAEPLKGCFTRWEPYSYTDQNNIPAGFSIEIYREALTRAGLEMKLTEMPWARCMHYVETAQMDVAVDGSEIIKNTISSNIKPIPWVLVLWANKKHRNEDFTGFESLAGSVVGYVRGYDYPKYFLENREIKLYPVVDDTQGLSMLHRQRLDYFFGDWVNSRHLKVKNNFLVYPLLPPAEVNYLNLTFHINFKQEQAQYEAALRTLFEDGTIDAAYEKYLGMSFKQFVQAYGEQ